MNYHILHVALRLLIATKCRLLWIACCFFNVSVHVANTVNPYLAASQDQAGQCPHCLSVCRNQSLTSADLHAAVDLIRRHFQMHFS